jgi:glycosyltransferase involved in cell wall biosynthesis
MKLSILICTIPERREQFKQLVNELRGQGRQFIGEAEVVYNDSPKGSMTIGAKRNKLLNEALGEYSVFIDDDDKVAPDYIETVLRALESKPDCVGYWENVIMDGRQERSLFSIKCKRWQVNNPPIDGFNYYRTPFAKTPIKTELCKQVMYRDMNFGEDVDFADRIYPLLKHEVLIEKEMYFYSYTSGQSIQERYGS